MSNRITPQSGILDVAGNILQNGKQLVVKDDALVLSEYKILSTALIDTTVEPKVVGMDVSAAAYDAATGFVKAKTLSSLSGQEVLGVAVNSISNATAGSLVTRGIITSNITGVTVGDPVYSTASGTLSTTMSAKVIGYILTTGANAKVFVDIKSQNTNYLVDLINGAATVPPGMVAPFLGTVSPTGWLMCDGVMFHNVNTYPNLYAVIGNNYGGTPAVDFLTPDYRGMFLRGTGTHGSLAKAAGGNFAGPALHVSELDMSQGHYHDPSAVTFSTTSGGTNYHARGNSPDASSTTSGAATQTTDGVNGTPRTGNETRPVSFGINYIIKY